MEFYFYEDCEYSQIVLNTIANLNIVEKVVFKDIRDNPEYAKELSVITGNETVPCLITESGPIRESIEIRKYLVSKFN